MDNMTIILDSICTSGMSGSPVVASNDGIVACAQEFSLMVHEQSVCLAKPYSKF
jgi:hypothetical protein